MLTTRPQRAPRQITPCRTKTQQSAQPGPKPLARAAQVSSKFGVTALAAPTISVITQTGAAAEVFSATAASALVAATGLAVGVWIGIGVGAVVAIIALIALIVCCCCCVRSSRVPKSSKVAGGV